jgi:signal transduction histidine kinase
LLQPLIRWVDQSQTEPTPGARARVRVQHLIALLQVLVGLPYVLLFVSSGVEWAVPVLLPVVFSSPAGLFTFTRRGRPDIGGRVVSVCGMLFISGCLVARGGMLSNAAAWMLVVPVFSNFMVGPRHGATMSLATAAVFAGMWTFESLGLPMHRGLPEGLLPYMPLIDYPAIALVLGGMLYVQAEIWETAEREAREAAQARYIFLATMSHEIRTPLNGVLGLTEVLLHSDLDPDQRQLAMTVRSSGKLLRSLLDDVLDYSKIDSGRLDIEHTPVDLEELCQELVQLWRGPAEEAGLTLSYTMTPEAPRWVLGDPTKLRQILGNLVSNAIKFTEKGSVTLEADAQGERLLLSVRDSGIGLSPEATTRIFEAFRQADGTTTRRYGGTGLGLAISQRLARFMGGDLEVRSEQGHGSTFTLKLPLLHSVPDTITAESPRPLGSLQGLEVLVAEDNLVNQLVIRRLLERHGVEVRMVADGQACLAAWREQPPDIILMDCQMPVCDGYEATRQIRAQGGTLPIIALTANSMPGDRAQCLEAGMNDHLGKPINMEILELALARWQPQINQRA